MPIDKRRTHAQIVAELMEAYHETGKIGNNIVPVDEEDALRIANKIAFEAKK